MTIRNLEFMFNPSAIALMGASRKLDARMKVVKSHLSAQRLAIRPYPKELEETIALPDGRTLLLRPIRPEDEPALQILFSVLSMDEVRLRFLHSMKVFSHELAARLTQIDYDREMALVLRAHAKIISHSCIPTAGRLCPIFACKILKIAYYSCGFADSDRPNPTQIRAPEMRTYFCANP